MVKYARYAITVGIALGLTGCATPPPSYTPIYPEPSYDKLGENPVCTPLSQPTVVTGSNGQQALRCVPDEDMCDDPTWVNIGAQQYPLYCPPPPPPPPRDDDDDDRPNPQNPTGGRP